jgi:hypothetical protein
MTGHDLPDLDERLRRLPAVVAVEAPAGLAERVAHRGHRRRRLRRAAAAAVLVGLVAGVVATRAAVLDRTTAPVLGPGLVVRDATPAQLAAGRWRSLPPLPPGRLAPRSGAVAVWTGRQLVVWGGLARDRSRTLADGAAYDPGTDRWEPLPPAPEGQWMLEDEGIAVWTGREVLVWGGVTIEAANPNVARPADGVAYDPARRSWRRLPRPPLPLRYVSPNQWVLWTGGELLAGGVEQGAGGGVIAGAYDPATDRWRMLPRSPGLTGGPDHLQARTAMWAGSRLLVWNFWSPAAHTANNRDAVTARPETEPDGIDLWAYDLAADRWTVLPDPPERVRRMLAGASMVWTGREVVIASAATARGRTVTRAGRYDPDRARWTPIAPPPRPGGRTTLAWAGAAVVELPRKVVYDPGSDRWLPLPPGPDGAGGSTLRTWDPERALLRTDELAGGAVRVQVLVPRAQAP